MPTIRRAHRNTPWKPGTHYVTLKDDVELLMHPVTPVFKEGHAPSEVEVHELARLRRMELQPELAAQLDEIAIWLYDLFHRKDDTIRANFGPHHPEALQQLMQGSAAPLASAQGPSRLRGSTPPIQGHAVSLHQSAPHHHPVQLRRRGDDTHIARYIQKDARACGDRM